LDNFDVFGVSCQELHNISVQLLHLASCYMLSIVSLVNVVCFYDVIVVGCVLLQAAGKFDVQVVERQLLYTGMLATVQIRQAGYNYRLTFEVFTVYFALMT